MPPITTRSRFDVRVGPMHTLEVLLQIRSSDLNWWAENLRDNERQLYKLIGRRILPSELKGEIQADIEREQKHKPINTKKKGGVVVGEVNLKKIADNKTQSKSVGRKRGNQSTTSKEKGKSKKPKSGAAAASKKGIKQQSSNAAINKDETNPDAKDKRPKLLRETGKWIMGKSIQACYVMEDIDRTASCSMAFRPMKQQEKQDEVKPNNGDEKTSPKKAADSSIDPEENMIPLATFRSWNKLSKRLNIWVFRFDPNDPTDMSVTEDGGFPRPDLLPLSDIFRQS